MERLLPHRIYYNGCVIAEIRDYRQSITNANYFTSYLILLKPTSLSLYNDVKAIISRYSSTNIWTNDSRFKLESKLIYLTSPKLCLEPNPYIGILSKKLSRKKLMFSNKKFLRLPRNKFKRITFANEVCKQYKFCNFLKNKKTSVYVRNPSTIDKKTNREITRMNFEYKSLEDLAASLAKTPNNSAELVLNEEYSMESIDPLGNSFMKLKVYLRPCDEQYFGTFVMSANAKEMPL